MRLPVLFSAGLGLLLACVGVDALAGDATPNTQRHVLPDGTELVVEGNLEGFKLDITPRVERDVTLAEITLTRATPAPPPLLTLKWSMPSVDISGLWSPRMGMYHVISPDWDDRKLTSTLTGGAPVMTLFSREENNRLTVAIADALNPVKLSAKVREEDARIHCSLELFSERHPAVTRYSTQLRFDRRPLPFYTVLRDVTRWWEGMDGYRPSPAPLAAREPLDSTWYSYHQHVDDQTVLKEIDQAAALGLKVMIVDDGWQTKDSGRGYAYAGDWRPERLTRMKEVTARLHAKGMKGALWYSVPLVGEKTEAARRFQGKFLHHDAELGAYILDPRYPDVRAYLIAQFRQALVEWGWDGLKLDFIDHFHTNDDTVLTAENGRDYASVYQAVDRLMEDLMADLRKINPDVMIEFRQPYNGPLIRKYGNMLRASDSPNASILNRQKIVDVRLLSGSTPVHADPIVWNMEEPVEAAALQLLDTLFAVPQVSMQLEKLPPAQRRMLVHYLDYWNANRDVLLDGEFSARGIFAQYTVLQARTPAKQIVGLYRNEIVAVDADAPADIDVVNARGPGGSGRMVLDFATAARYQVIVRDCLGAERSRQEFALPRGVRAFDVPPSGMLSLHRL